ncbi:bifunctional riboflavin kinase/FAD synthetase [Nanchangia anserum]|uniref:Riboflavin biosynthesis protein n=1 Tax=Nanchangia anserum TaxID=2692125 RepID=A0A8I0KR30_9ACTO|nr:bifunctional riboflavin kinase/FAD synthetase [Nanchangia anserum]
MDIWKSLTQVPGEMASVATIGIFDGVHLGHRRILTRVVERAEALGVRAIALTFDPHPATLHAPEAGIDLIMPLPDRLNALAALGIDATLVESYTWHLAGMSAEDFVRTYFVEGLGARVVVVGRDARFGRDNEGDLQTLKQLGERYGFAVDVVNDVHETEADRRYSSTWVRQLLARGDVEAAARILGHPYRLRGDVVHGYARGRTLGFPTANLCAGEVGMVPADGVYAGWLIVPVAGTRAVAALPSAISVGTNPQFSGTQRAVEAHVLGRTDLNLYGTSVAIDFVKRLRGMVTLDSVEALQDQMDDDLRASADVLGVPPAGRVDPSAVTAR